MLTLIGCGGSGGSGWQTVQGHGYRFDAPAGWKVVRAGGGLGAAHGSVDLVEVRTFRLVKAYRSELFAAASRELDGRVAELAKLQRGRVAAKLTLRVSRMEARGYRIAYGKLVEELTFVLDDHREYELLCRRVATAPDTNCRRLVTSFRLG